MCEGNAVISTRHTEALTKRYGRVVIQIVGSLAEAGISDVAVLMGADNPKQHAELLRPTNGATFADMCTFVSACVESGMI